LQTPGSFARQRAVTQRAALVMFEIDGYTGEDIAQAQQVLVNTVRARIHRARKQLNARLAVSAVRLNVSITLSFTDSLSVPQ
jgi:DNA-directed RNA polymerase specialized sigma24 family protein